jgi:hypothetical protein
VVSEWEMVAGAGVEYYTCMFASKQNLDKELMADILKSFKGKISNKKKYVLDTKWMLLELTESSLKMAKKRAPGPDGSPVEHITLQWAILGPLVRKALNKGLECLTRFVHRKAPNPEKTTKNPQFIPMEELIAIKPAEDN